MNRKEVYNEANYFFPLDPVIDVAVERVRSAYQLSQSLGLGKLYVCFSGGKDSVTVYGICKRAFGDKLFDCCDFNYAVTGIDPPELVYFIRDIFPFVHWNHAPKPIWQSVIDHKTPPSRRIRYCCSEYKERGGEGRFCVTGVRWAESRKRKEYRNVFEGGAEKILGNDNTEDRRELEHCIPKQKYICNPIVDWSENEVWRFIVKDNLPYCSLYDKGFTRIGCIGCPLASTEKRKEEFTLYPCFKRKWIQTFDRMIEKRKEAGLPIYQHTGEELFEWWINLP